jgi:RHS repeat-associated protein
LTRTVNSVTETYEYDDADKLLNVKINNSPVKEYTYDDCGRLIAVESSAGVTSLSWDYEDRLIGITYPNQSTNSFGYNPFGARVSKSDSIGTSTYFRAGTSVVSPVLSDGSATYTPGISERRNNNSTYYHSDLKNTTAQTASNETVSGTNEYDAFGNLVNYTGDWNGPFAYGGAFGYQTDGDSGLMLLGHRYYDASTGRFLSRDSAKDGSNWYAYCNNNPITFFDYSGEIAVPVIVGGALFVGGLLWTAYDIWTNPDDPMSYVSAIPLAKLAKLGIFMKKVIDPIVDGISKSKKGKRGGESAAAARGRLIHAEYDFGPGYKTRSNQLPSGRKPDAVNYDTGHVYELKPNNPRAIKRGEKQLGEYLKELQEWKPEKKWSGTVITYD